MPLKSHRPSDSRDGGLVFESMGDVEEMWRRAQTPGLDTLNRASKMGIRLKSVHLISKPSHQRPRTTSHLRSQTHPFYESIVVPIGKKRGDVGDSRTHSPQTTRSRSQTCKVSRLPSVTDNSTMTCKPVLPYYAESLTPVSAWDRPDRPSSVWTFYNQASRLEKGREALDKCRHLKKASEIIPHRVERCYYMSGAPKKVHARYDIQDVDVEALQEMTRSRLRSRTTTPSTSSKPTPFSPVTSPTKVTRSPYGKKVRKLGHIKAYTFEHNTVQMDGESCLMCPEYIVPCLFDMSDKLPESPPPARYPYSPTPKYGHVADRNNATEKEEEDITLGVLIDKYLPQSKKQKVSEKKKKPKRPSSSGAPNCGWLRARRSWSDSDLNVLDVNPDVLDVLNIDKKGEYRLKLPQKKFLPSCKKSVTPSPRCCSDFARRKYPKISLPGISTGRNCKRKPLRYLKRQQSSPECDRWLPEVQCYKIRFHQDSRLAKGVVMSTQIESGNRVERVENNVLLGEFPMCRPIHRRDHHPVRWVECAKLGAHGRFFIADWIADKNLVTNGTQVTREDKIVSERTPRRETHLTGGLPINQEVQFETYTDKDASQMLVESNQHLTQATDASHVSSNCAPESPAKEDDKSEASSVCNDWPPARTQNKGNDNVTNSGEMAAEDVDDTPSASIIRDDVKDTDGVQPSLPGVSSEWPPMRTQSKENDSVRGDIKPAGEVQDPAPTTIINNDMTDTGEASEEPVQAKLSVTVNNMNKDCTTDQPVNNRKQDEGNSNTTVNGITVKTATDITPRPEKEKSDHHPEVSAQPNILKSVEFKFPGESSFAGNQGTDNKPETSRPNGGVSQNSSSTDGSSQRRPAKSKTPGKSNQAPELEAKTKSNLASESDQNGLSNGLGTSSAPQLHVPASTPPTTAATANQHGHSESSTKPLAIFTVTSDGVRAKKDDVLGMDFSEERRQSQAEGSDSDSDGDSSSESDWDMRVISGVKSSFLKSEQKLSSLRANTSHLNAKTNAWVMDEVYSFVSPEQKRVFEKHFRALDEGGNGVVSRDDLQLHLFDNATQKDLDLFVKVFDLNNDNTVDVREFVTVAALNDKLCGNITLDDSQPLKLDLPKLAYYIAAFKEMFDLTDSDRDLSLSIEELMLMITAGLSEEIGTNKLLVDMIVKTVDSDHSGRIEFVEFLSFIPFFLGIFSHLLRKPALIEDIERARCAVRRALRPQQRYRSHYKEKTKDIWVD